VSLSEKRLKTSRLDRPAVNLVHGHRHNLVIWGLLALEAAEEPVRLDSRIAAPRDDSLATTVNGLVEPVAVDPEIAIVTSII